MGGVDWGDYVPLDPGVDRPLHEVSARDARDAFARLMAAKEERKAALVQLVARNGIGLTSSDNGIRDLNGWFAAHVAGDGSSTGRLLPIWYAVANDIALFLGDAMIERCPSLEWRLFDRGRKDVAFQRHVLMGFSRVSNPKYNVDIDRLVAGFGARVAHRHGVGEDEFLTWVRTAADRC